MFLITLLSNIPAVVFLTLYDIWCSCSSYACLLSRKSKSMSETLVCCMFSVNFLSPILDDLIVDAQKLGFSAGLVGAALGKRLHTLENFANLTQSGGGMLQCFLLKKRFDL